MKKGPEVNEIEPTVEAADEGTTATLQLDADRDGEVTDATGMLKDADGSVDSIEGTDLTEASVTQKIDRLISNGADTIQLDVSRTEMTDALKDTILTMQRQLKKRSSGPVELNVIGLDADNKKSMGDSMEQGHDHVASTDDMHKRVGLAASNDEDDQGGLAASPDAYEIAA